MNHKQRILTCLVLVIVTVTLFLVPWQVADRFGGHYELSAYWHPVQFDESGVVRPVLLYAEWGVLALGYVILLPCLRTTKS